MLGFNARILFFLWLIFDVSNKIHCSTTSCIILYLIRNIDQLPHVLCCRYLKIYGVIDSEITYKILNYSIVIIFSFVFLFYYYYNYFLNYLSTVIFFFIIIIITYFTFLLIII
jgi:hypothetical protein